jgi:PhnB protein
MAVKPIPDGYHTVTPYITVSDAAAAIAFYVKAFGATEVFRMELPGGGVAHAEITIDGSRIMIGGPCPQSGTGAANPDHVSMSLMVYVPDVDARFQQALAAGAREKAAVDNKFYGDRSGSLIDPFGHVWHFATHIEDVSHEECKRRMDEMLKNRPAA